MRTNTPSSVSLLICVILSGVVSVGLTAERVQPTPEVDAAFPHRALLDRYCVTCHNARLNTAGLALDSLDLAHVDGGAPFWEQVIRKLRVGAMPPPGRPRPDRSSVAALVSYLETELDRAALAHPATGRTETFHRLNRAEYENAVRDLLQVDIDISALLPADDAEHEFLAQAAVRSGQARQPLRQQGLSGSAGGFPFAQDSGGDFSWTLGGHAASIAGHTPSRESN